jgi:hypothetical protein
MIPGGVQRRTPVVRATGVFHWWPRSKKDLQPSESHPAMIGAGCPVPHVSETVLCETLHTVKFSKPLTAKGAEMAELLKHTQVVPHCEVLNDLPLF